MSEGVVLALIVLSYLWGILIGVWIMWGERDG